MAVSPKTIIKLKDLGSRIVSKQIAPRGKTISATSIKKGNLLEGLIGFFTEKIGNFFRSINFKKIWEWIVSGVNYLYNFNWQATDEELDEQIKQSWLAVEQRMFGVIGRSLGYLVCGAVPGAIMTTFNAPLGAFLLKELGDEAVADMLSELGGFFQLAGNAARQTIFLKAYQSIRSLIKKANKIPGIRQGLNKLGINNNIIDNWGEEKGKNWSFSSAVQNWIESLNSDRLQDNIEEFMDEFGDACIEAGYTLANGLDEYFGLDGVNKGIFDLMGKERQVTFTPDRDVPSETFTLRGRTESIKQQMGDILNTSQIVDNRDMGLILPSDGDWDNTPIVNSNGIEVTFEFINYENPPYYTKDRRNNVVRSKLVVPNCVRSKITWNNILTTFTGDTATTRKFAFMKGNFRCECQMENGRKLVVYADSENEGETMLEKLASFTPYKIVYPISVRKHIGANKRPGYNLTRVSTRQHIMAIKVCNWEKLTKFEAVKNVNPKVNRKSQTVRLKMHYEQKPSWFDKELNDALSNTLNDG